jgi:hypothetical protein
MDSQMDRLTRRQRCYICYRADCLEVAPATPEDSPFILSGKSYTNPGSLLLICRFRVDAEGLWRFQEWLDEKSHQLAIIGAGGGVGLRH